MSHFDDTQGIPQVKPALHHDFKVGDRVELVGMNELDGRTGTISGIGTVHVSFQYIISLDLPLEASKWPGKSWTTILVPGGCLKIEE